MHQLLDFAAAAAREAGINVVEDAAWGWSLDGEQWKPQEDPYQAMQLAAAMHMLVEWGGGGRVIVVGSGPMVREYGEGPLATACMAITKAAAQQRGWAE
ncbi:MAG: hypothetical protein KJ890_15650 [Gammaproteobacteria bacterium]|nr:hypothetical protein [Gammaproteobacteria bacterium]MBU1803864.1 hypothetical protein [Gammaproteobacteria bacterium]